MAIEFACPSCGRQIRVREDAAGKGGKCNRCGKPIVVPLPTSVQVIKSVPPELIAPSANAGSPVVPYVYPAVPVAHPGQPVIQYVPVPVPVPYQAAAPAPPPNIVVNVTQNTRATARSSARAKATSVAVSNNAAPPYANRIATAAVVLAVLALAFSWIPYVGVLTIPLAVLALVLAALGVLLALFNRGAGFGRAIAGGLLGFVAIGVAVVSTGVETARHAAATAKLSQEAPAVSTIPVRAEPRRVAATVVPAQHATMKPAAVPVPPTAEPAAAVPKIDSDEAARKKFGGILKNARDLAKAGVFPGARKMFQRVIDGAPGTAIAAEAQKGLAALPPE